ncbi:competence protein ComK [Apilactobacillus quenuiae]|uniref:competence protein ComK n=1 Tax=Apilactobacillus quenuiae TaxID=2008377 RepID=UPI000D011BA6|nr:competence protein ComK [Apilactobacillus quenuiae]
MLSTITKDPINYSNNIKYVNFKDLRYSHVIRKVKYHKPKWNKVMMLLDFSEHSKRYPTLVIEEDQGFYLIEASINVMINQMLEENTIITRDLVNNICDCIGLKHTYPLITAHSLFIALPKFDRNKCNHSWINVAFLNHLPSLKNHKYTDFLLKDNQFICLPISENYVNNKIDDLNKLKSYFNSEVLQAMPGLQVLIKGAKLYDGSRIKIKDCLNQWHLKNKYKNDE